MAFTAIPVKEIVFTESRISTDFTILNSVSLFEKARSVIKQYEVINLYLDNDKTGQNCSRYAIQLSEKYKGKSSLYGHYKDVNEWMDDACWKVYRKTVK